MAAHRDTGTTADPRTGAPRRPVPPAATAEATAGRPPAWLTETPPLALRVIPFVLLGLSVLIGWGLSPELIEPERMRQSYLPTLVLLAFRIALQVVHNRVRSATPAIAAGYVLHAITLVAGVALNPFLCIYAFFGYMDAARLLSDRAGWVAAVVTGVTCGFGQAGGLPGLDATPLLFLALATVNVMLALVMMRIMAGHEREVDARARAVEALARAHEENLALHDQLMRQAHDSGIADERARLSRELHDTVAQGLVGVIRQLENLPGDLQPSVRDRIDRAERAARDCLTEARRAVRALAPRQLEDSDLADAVRAEVENWSLTHGVVAQVRVEGEPADGPGDDVVLRVVQEALANVSRHADARTVTVTLTWLAGELHVDVRDDGIGFDPEAVVRGHGLDGMTERLHAAGGRLEIESRPGDGTTVAATLPRGSR
ncbi:MAG: hypothetical protein KBG85_08190 [Micropruina sp.]|nr:hypothetical protein [Micropruina sp.]